MSDPRLVYTPSFEGLFVLGAGPRLTPQARERLRGAGLDLSKPLLPAYPATTWASTIRIAAEELHPDLAPEEGIRRVGELSLSGYTNTLVGRGLFGLLRILGMRRSMLRLARNMGGGTNYLQASATELGPQDFRAELNDVTGVPSFYQGVLSGATEQVGTRAEVLIEDGRGPGCVYRVRW